MNKLLPDDPSERTAQRKGVHCGLIHTDFRTPKRLVNWRPFALATITENARNTVPEGEFHVPVE